MVIPKPVYEILPVIYVGGGIACISISESTGALLSSLLLAITGLLVLIIRRNYRTAQRTYTTQAYAHFSPLYNSRDLNFATLLLHVSNTGREKRLSSSKQSTTPQVGVGAVVFCNGAVLLVERRNPPCANEWAIPGGKVRLGETLQQAAEREILEETGIRIKAEEPIYAFDLIERDTGGNVQWHYAIIDLQAEYLGGVVCPGDDAAAAGWFRPEDLVRITVNATTRQLLRTRFGFGN